MSVVSAAAQGLHGPTGAPESAWRGSTARAYAVVMQRLTSAASATATATPVVAREMTVTSAAAAVAAAAAAACITSDRAPAAAVLGA